MRRRTASFLPTAALMMFAAVYTIAPGPAGAGGDEGTEASKYYSGCKEARAAGAAPIYRGQPGYREDMDGDGDGIACEPYRNGG